MAKKKNTKYTGDKIEAAIAAPSSDALGFALPEPPKRNDTLPLLELEHVPLASLKPADRRIRKVETAQVARARLAIERFGFVVPILIRADHEIIDGHIRLAALQALGATNIACIRVDHLSPREIRELRIALNRIQERGNWDFEVLKVEFEALIELGTDLTFTGFEVAEIDGILFGADGSNNIDPQDTDVPFPDRDMPPVTKLGDLWCTGAHCHGVGQPYPVWPSPMRRGAAGNMPMIFGRASPALCKSMAMPATSA